MQQPSYQTALRAILSYQLIARHLDDERKALMADLDLQPGEKANIVTEWGESLGSVSRTKTKFTAVITDPAIVAADYADEVEFKVSGATDELIDFLLDNGGEKFLTPVLPEAVERQLAADALNTWRRTGQVPDGWEIKESRTSLRATPTQLAKDMADDTMRALAPRLALEMGDETDA